jgi:steroid 5-alpha reductase family enzyme
MITDWISSLPLLLAMAAAGWLYAYRHSNVNIVDSLWSLFFLAAALVYTLFSDGLALSSWLLLVLVAIWSLRLSAHLAQRNAGKAEDHRYAAMRQRNPNFARRSLVTVFGLQAVLAWIISVPLVAAISTPAEFGVLHMLALALFATGFYFEAVGDWQLAKFRSNPENRDKVLDTGVWGLSRHPNYFGEACIWWSFYLFALAAGFAWTLFSPLIMTFLLLKVSGVSLLEKDIEERRPGYRRYVESTSAFVPWFPRKPGVSNSIKEKES